MNYIVEIIIGIVFFRDSSRKIKDIYKFYEIICEYEIAKQDFKNMLLASIIPVYEIFLAIFIFIPKFKVISYLMGILLEIFYLSVIVRRYGETIESSCNCFILNNSMIIDARLIFKCLLIIGVMLLLIIWR